MKYIIAILSIINIWMLLYILADENVDCQINKMFDEYQHKFRYYETKFYQNTDNDKLRNAYRDSCLMNLYMINEIVKWDKQK